MIREFFFNKDLAVKAFFYEQLHLSFFVIFSAPIMFFGSATFMCFFILQELQ